MCDGRAVLAVLANIAHSSCLRRCGPVRIAAFRAASSGGWRQEHSTGFGSCAACCWRVGWRSAGTPPARVAAWGPPYTAACAARRRPPSWSPSLHCSPHGPPLGPLLTFWQPQHEEAYLRQQVLGAHGWPAAAPAALSATQSGHLAPAAPAANQCSLPLHTVIPLTLPPQMACRLFLVRHWAPRSDPMLATLLLALHSTLLLRLLLAGGLEQCPLPLLGAYLSWHALRMTEAWVSSSAAWAGSGTTAE